MQVTADALLQINATVIAGALILLTLTFFGTGYSEIENRFYIYYYTAFIIIPFALSSVIVFIAREDQHRALFAATSLSASGFLILGINIAYLAFINSPLVAEESIAVQCAMEPKKFNITEPAECAEFSAGSLAEQCAFNPDKFKIAVAECRMFMRN